MSRFAGPGWRIPGAIIAWLLFSFNFTLMYLGSGVVAGIGGSCASGGPFVIETECPAIVLYALPFGFFGVFAACVVAHVFQGGFAAPMLFWGWSILFVGLSIPFFMMIPLGGVVVGVICGTLFVAMGLAPLAFELRAGLGRLVLGKSNVHDVLFTAGSGAQRTLFGFGHEAPGSALVPTPGDWVLSIVVSLASIAAGAAVGMRVFSVPVLAGPAE